jgi:hypothetical protein
MSSSVIKILDNDSGVVKCFYILTIKVGTFARGIKERKPGLVLGFITMV